MDCIDCHNRPTHQFRSAESELDEALETGRIDRSLGFVRREGLKALKAGYGSPAEARAGIATALEAFYQGNAPEVLAFRRAEVATAAAALAEMWARNVWPQMRIDWGTYPSQLGHVATPGCFRCHDEEHATAEGVAISQDCGLCHALLADGEEDPAVLRQLAP
jgi:hypothetical protein